MQKPKYETGRKVEEQEMEQELSKFVSIACWGFLFRICHSSGYQQVPKSNFIP